MSHPLFERHRALLDQALNAISTRGYWTPFPESPSPKVYGESAPAAGKAAFDALLNKPFAGASGASVGSVGGEMSPYGIALGVTYPNGGTFTGGRTDAQGSTGPVSLSPSHTLASGDHIAPCSQPIMGDFSCRHALDQQRWVLGSLAVRTS